MTKAVINKLKPYVHKDPEFVMEVIDFAFEKYHPKTKSTSGMSKKTVMKWLGELDEISTPALKQLRPELSERSLRHIITHLRSAIKAVS